MKKRFVIFGIIAILLCIGLSRCEDSNKNMNSEKNRFIGTWQNTTKTYTQTMNLFSNGSCIFFIHAGT